MIKDLDDLTRAAFIRIPAHKVALIQSIVESYEGVASVRTLDIKNSLIAILYAKDQEADCLKILEDLKPEIGWEYAEQVEEKFLENYFGYLKEKHQGEQKTN